MKKVTDKSLIDSLNQEYDDSSEKLNESPIDYVSGESKGVGGIASDALNKAIELALGLPGAIANIPSEVYGATKQSLINPKRASQNILGGFGQLGHGVLSAPANARDYLVKKDLLSQGSPSLRLPESSLPKDYNYAEALGAHGQQAGDELLRSLPSSIAMAPLGEGLTALDESMAPMLAKTGKVSKANRLGAERDLAKAAYEQDQALVDALLKKHAEEGTGLNKPETITRQMNENARKIQELHPATQIPEENLQNLLNWPTGEDLVPNAMKAKDMQLREIEHYIGKGKAHDVELASEINNSVKQAKQHIQKNYYEPVEEYTKNNYVQLPRTPDVVEIEKELEKISKSPEFKQSPGFDKLKQELIKQRSKTDLVPAHDFVKQWKETKQAAAKARRKGYQEGGESQAYWQDQAENLKQLADKQLQVLQHHLPPEHFNKLMQANKLWKEEITPFYGNKIYEQAKKLGRVDVSNIMHEVRGHGMGQDKMRELLLSNPKLTKLAIGHSYAKAPEKLLTAGENEQEFIAKLPQLQGMLERLKGHNRNIEIAKAHENILKANRARTEGVHQELFKTQKERQHAIAETERLNQHNIDLGNKRQELEESFKNKDISKEKYEKLDKEHQETIKNNNRLLRTIKKGLGYGAAAIGGFEAQDIIRKLLG
jgi:hypothetical protein